MLLELKGDKEGGAEGLYEGVSNGRAVSRNNQQI